MTTTPPSEPSDVAHAQNVAELIAASKHLQLVLEGIQSLARLADRWRERAEAAEKRQADALTLVEEQKTLINQLKSQREDLLAKNAKLSSVTVVDVKVDDAIKERDYWRGMAERWHDKHDEVFRLWQERIVEIANFKRISDGRSFIEAMRDAIRSETVREARTHAKCWSAASLYAGDHAHVLAKICEEIARELESGK